MNKSLNFFRNRHHRFIKSKGNRRRRISPTSWNGEFFVGAQSAGGSTYDIYVWKWKEGQNPTFMYSYEYQERLFPTAFFVWKNYLVLIPNPTVGCCDQTSVIRTYDLNENMKLVGSYDFPTRGKLRRYV